MIESDWRKFRDMVPMLRERYVGEQNARLARMLADPKKTETQRFWDTFKTMEKQALVLEDCLDGQSRSKMWMHMELMVRAGMLKRDDLTVFSDELRRQLLELFDRKR